MPSTKPPSATIARWLRDNGHRLGGLTGQDWPALKAAVQIVELWTSADYPARGNCERAFQCVVLCMQPHLRYLAYHAIAHVGDWSHRDELWDKAGLALPTDIPACKYEPSMR